MKTFDFPPISTSTPHSSVSRDRENGYRRTTYPLPKPVIVLPTAAERASIAERTNFAPKSPKRGVSAYTGAVAVRPPAMPVAEARIKIREQVLLALSAPADRVDVLAADVGCGKSRAMIDELIKTIIDERRDLQPGESPKTRVLFFPNRSLADEWAKNAAEFIERAQAAGVSVAVLEGKSEKNCRNFAVVEPLRDAGCRTSAVCGSEQDEGVRRAKIANSEQRQKNDTLAIIASSDDEAVRAKSALSAAERKSVVVLVSAWPAETTVADITFARVLMRSGYRFARRPGSTGIGYAIAPTFGSAIAVRGRARVAGFVVLAPEDVPEFAGRLSTGLSFGFVPAAISEKTLVCAFRDACEDDGYYSQAEKIEHAELVFTNHAWLAMDRSTNFLARIPRLVALIIDENPIGALMRSNGVAVDDLLAPIAKHAGLDGVARRLMDLFEVRIRQTVSETERRAAYKAALAETAKKLEQVDADRRAIIEIVVKAAETGTDWGTAVIDAGMADRVAPVLDALSAMTGKVGELIGPHLDPKAAAEIAALHGATQMLGKTAAIFHSFRRRVALIKKLRAMGREVGPVDRTITIERNDHVEGMVEPPRFIVNSWVSPVFAKNIAGKTDEETGEQIEAAPKVIVLDAHAHREIYERLFSGLAVEIHPLRLATPHTRIVQITDRTNSNSSLLAHLGADDATRIAAAERAEQVVKLIGITAQKHAKNGLLVCATKKVLDLADKAMKASKRELAGTVATLNFGRCRGTNAFEHFGAVLAIGRVQMKKNDAERQAAALEAHRAMTLGETPRAIEFDFGASFPLLPGVYQLSSGRHMTKAVPTPSDALVQAIVSISREDEIEQALGRVRPASRTSDKPATLYVACSLPLHGFVVDELVSMRDALGEEAPLVHIMRVFGGVLPLSAKLIAAQATSLGVKGLGKHHAITILKAADVKTGDFATPETIAAALRRLSGDEDAAALLYAVRARTARQSGKVSAFLVSATLGDPEAAVRRFYAAMRLELGLFELIHEPPRAAVVSIDQVREIATKSRDAVPATDTDLVKAANDHLTVAKGRRAVAAAMVGGQDALLRGRG